MDSLNYTDFRQHLAENLDKVNDNHEPLLITRRNGKPAVLMSLDDFNSFQETAYLMRSPGNAARLNHAIDEIERGNVSTHELEE